MPHWRASLAVTPLMGSSCNTLLEITDGDQNFAEVNRESRLYLRNNGGFTRLTLTETGDMASSRGFARTYF